MFDSTLTKAALLVRPAMDAAWHVPAGHVSAQDASTSLSSHPCDGTAGVVPPTVELVVGFVVVWEVVVVGDMVDVAGAAVVVLVVAGAEVAVLGDRVVRVEVEGAVVVLPDPEVDVAPAVVAVDGASTEHPVALQQQARFT